MRIISNLLLTLILIIALFSCKSNREKKVEQINKESSEIFSSALADIKRYDYTVNADSLLKIYTKIASDSAQSGLEFAKKIRDEANALKEISKAKLDSIDKVIQAKNAKKDSIEQKKWENSKAGKIQKKHSDWSREDCEKIANNQIWIGMSINMLKYERGTPSRANPSNYGKGTEWQWCWDDYTPSCFYGGDDGIITSYN
jgi:hypothetical protein